MSAEAYVFTTDWFSRSIPALRAVLADLPGRPGLAILEIGSWEGRSAVWLASEMFSGGSGELHCIDNWEGPEGRQAEALFDQNLRLTQRHRDFTLMKHKRPSRRALATLPDDFFDVAYIDGSHLACDVLTDLVMSWPLVKDGGVIICDDYGLTNEMEWHDGFDSYPIRPIPRGPKWAVDAFMDCFEYRHETLHAGWQVMLRKLRRTGPARGPVTDRAGGRQSGTPRSGPESRLREG